MVDKRGDVSMFEDLFYGIKNLTALEEHCKASYHMTKDKKWLELNDIVREMRTRWMILFVKKENSQIWCSTKHMFNIIMSAQEVSNRLYSIGKKELANEFEEDAKTINGVLFLFNEINDKEAK